MKLDHRSGIDVAEIIRKLENMKNDQTNIPIYIMTSQMEQDRYKNLSKSITGTISRPLRKSEVTKIFERKEETPLTKYSILIVDDDSFLNSMFTNMLK